MVYQGGVVTTKASFIVTDYLTKQMLSKIGYTFDIKGLEDWEVESYSIIANTIAKEEERELKKQTRK